ncbi:MAG: PAS domain-containing sensor histidine kinase [Firmicutes bacterium]|nr:PAS domain-containing sensor histidine kinase [Bacillota bacterium]
MSFFVQAGSDIFAAQAPEERNPAFNILCRTITDVEGVSEERAYQILCTNLMEICNASFAVLAVFDNDISMLKLKAVENSGVNCSLACREIGPFSHHLTPEDIAYLKTARIRDCSEHKVSLAAIFNHTVGNSLNGFLGRCLQISFVNGEDLVGAAIVSLRGNKLEVPDIVESYISLTGIILRKILLNDKLKDNLDKFKMFVSNINDIVYLRDTAGKVVFINDSVRELLGYEPYELLNNTLLFELMFGNPKNKEILHLITGELKGESSDITYECEVMSKHGNPVCLEIKDKLIFENGRVALIQCVCRDITARKKAEKLLIEKNIELGEFAQIVSHDLKAPLGVMKAFLVNIKEDPSLFEVFSNQLLNQADRLLSHIDGLLKLCKAGKILSEKTEICIKSLMEICITNLRTPDVSVELEMMPDMPKLYGDYLAMNQVFSNLVSNSIRYRDREKGSVVIEVYCYQRYGLIEIIYKDNGLGISKEYLPNIFKSGFTAGRMEGTGFGLAIVRKIVEAHNGNIRIESEGEGKGVTFFIKIPNEIHSAQ